MKSRSIAVNDIEKPYRITINSRQEMFMFLNGAYNIKDAIEIYFDGIESIYYICPSDKFNVEIRKEVLKRVSRIIEKNIPAKFNMLIKNNPKIPEDIFREVAV